MMDLPSADTSMMTTRSCTEVDELLAGGKDESEEAGWGGTVSIMAEVRKSGLSSLKM